MLQVLAVAVASLAHNISPSPLLLGAFDASLCAEGRQQEGVGEHVVRQGGAGDGEELQAIWEMAGRTL